MSAFWGVARYEYHMAIRRWGMWLAMAIAAVPYVLPAATEPIMADSAGAFSVGWMWAFGGNTVLQLNLLMPIIAGIVMADRLPRDLRLGTRELLASTPLRRPAYVLGKYLGVVAAALTPVLAAIGLLAAILSVRGLAAGLPAAGLLALVAGLLAGFLAITVPAYLFIGAFSVACPAVLPVRVYQVLYVGYWFWGNFLNPKVIPTLAGSPLTPSGEYAAAGFFAASKASGMVSLHTPAEAVLSIAALLTCAAAALVALERYLAWQERRA
ncbi:MAG: ABC transporter permease [Anaerolineae bacterium]|nr:ABC transporter permease [Anaerolineae bacterium]